MRYIFSFLVLIFFAGCYSSNTEYTIPPTVIKDNSNNTNLQSIKNDVELLDTNTTIKEGKKEKVFDTLAIIVPLSDIGKYAIEAVNSANIYSIYADKNIKIEVFPIQTQSKKAFEKVFEQIKTKDIKKIIAMVTLNHFDTFSSVFEDKQTIYLPLILRDDIESYSTNIIFGAINYKSQIDKLISYSSDKLFIDFYDDSPIGKKIDSYIPKDSLLYSHKIDSNSARYGYIVSRNKTKLKHTLILNTPIIKSAILLSQLNAKDIKPPYILSTQLNYTPYIFSLTQKSDRENKIIIANSIGDIDDKLLQYNELMNNNIKYNWVNYSVSIGIEYLIYGDFHSFKDIRLEENQIVYPINLYKVRYYSFKKLGE